MKQRFTFFFLFTRNGESHDIRSRNLSFLPQLFIEAKEAKEKLNGIAIFPEETRRRVYLGRGWLGRGRLGGKYRLSEERRVDGRQASKCSHRSQSPKCLHHRDGIRPLSAVSGRLEFVRESFE